MAPPNRTPDPTPEARARLETFAATLLRWNATINLVSRRDAEQIWQRHIADSLQLAAFATPWPARATDLGSGGGFPGLVLSIAYGLEVDLVEEDQRKCAFLREAARLTAAPARVHAVRIESATILPAPLVTARALGPLDRLLAYAAPLLAPDGECWFLKGREAEAEIATAALTWAFGVDRRPSATDPAASLLRITGLRRRAFGASAQPL